MPSEGTSKITTKQRILVGIAGIGSFLGCSYFFFYLFQSSQVDSITSTVMSIIASSVVVWIILSLSGILKEFTLKGGSFELTAKLKDEINNVRLDVADSRRDMIEKLADIKLSVNTIQSSRSESSINYNYYRTKDEFNEILKKSGIPESQVGPKKEIPEGQIEKLDAIFNRLKALEDNISHLPNLTISDLMARANYYHYKENYNKAKELYSKILERDNENIYALLNRASSKIELDDFDGAIQDLNKIIALDPDHLGAIHNMGVAYAGKNNWDESIKWYTKVLKINPNFSMALRNLGTVLKNKGQLDEGLKYFEKAYEIEQSPDIIIQLANGYLHKREFNKAKELAQKIIAMEPVTNSDKKAFMMANIILGEYKKALDMCDVLLLKRPDDETILYNKACALSLLNRQDEAILILQKVFQKNTEWKNSAKTEPDFDNLRKNTKFLKLID